MKRPKSPLVPTKQSSWTGAAWACAAGVLCGTLAFAPARWLSSWVQDASGGHVRLENTRGTVWQGRADLLLSGGPGSRDAAALPQGIGWRIAPLWQNGLGMSLDITAPCCSDQPMRWQLTWTGTSPRLTLLAHQSEWPAQWLSALGAPWNTVQLQGRLGLKTTGLTLEPQSDNLRLQGSATIQALDMSSALSTLKPLGDYALEIAPDSDAQPVLQLRTQRGVLHLDGEGHRQNRRWQFRGMAEAAPGSETSLSNLLNLLGRRDGPRAHISLG